jgi:hypothetical protein
MKIRAIWLSIFVLIFAIPTVDAGSLYRWVDANGVVQITDRKPMKKIKLTHETRNNHHLK